MHHCIIGFFDNRQIKERESKPGNSRIIILLVVRKKRILNYIEDA